MSIAGGAGGSTSGRAAKVGKTAAVPSPVDGVPDADDGDDARVQWIYRTIIERVVGANARLVIFAAAATVSATVDAAAVAYEPCDCDSPLSLMISVVVFEFAIEDALASCTCRIDIRDAELHRDDSEAPLPASW